MVHYVARIVVEKVTPAEKPQYANQAEKPRQVEEVFSSVVKADGTDAGIDTLKTKITAVVEAGL